MEPPFYADLDIACRNMDLSKLKTIGPFAMAIWSVLDGGRFSDQKRRDSIEKGSQF